MIQFHGWRMPLQYTGIHAEHRAVRSEAGLFDVSHMGRLTVRGPGASTAVDRLTTNWASRLAVNQGQYSLMCDPSGGILDDLIVYRLGPEDFLLCVNASNREKDYRWIQEQIESQITVTDISPQKVQLALQGPCAEDILQQLTPHNLADLPYYSCMQSQVAEVDALVARTGYTGEDGFELYLSPGYMAPVCNQILAASQGGRVRPVGLGARDTLRLEMGYVLYGNDITQETTPLEARLGWVIKWEKKEFIGRESLWKQREEGVRRKLVGFEMLEKGIPRPGYRLWSGSRPVGEITSGNLSPSLGKAIGLGYVATELSAAGTPLEVEIRNRRVRAKVLPTPFYHSQVKRKTAPMKKNEA